jgi:tyrosine-protein phosphatase SIW14
LTLVQDDYSEENRAFFEQEGIALHQIGIPANKEPFVSIPDEKIRRALRLVLDKRNHPMLIHCNKGKHRTGCLVGCLRKMQCWSATAVFDEYRRFSFPKSRVMDQLFIELFQPVSPMSFSVY